MSVRTLSPVDRVLEAIRGQGGDPRKTGREWLAHCPAHEDGKASLSITEGAGGRALVKCRAGCETRDVVARLGLEWSDLFEEPKPKDAPRKIVAEYEYRDERGAILYQAVRFDPKGFLQRRPDGRGGWEWKLGDVRRVLFRLPELLAADPARTAYVVEGEKDALALEELGLVATTNAGGAGKWRAEYSEALRGRSVVILPDNDEPGRKHAAEVARSLQGIAASTRVLELPNLPNKGDVSDWLRDGGTREELERLALETPEWTEREPGDDPIGPEDEPGFELESPGEWIEPRELPEIHIAGGKLPEIVDQAEAALLEAGEPRVFQRGVVLVRIARVETGAERRGIKRQPGALTVHIVEPLWMLERLTTAARFGRWNAKEKKLVPTDCPASVANTLLARVGAWKAPVLRGIIEAPTLREDGSIFQEPGFDEESGLYFDPGAVRFPRLPELLTQDDARRALALLKEMLEEFPFVEGCDRSVVVSAILTGLVRKSLESAPLHAFSAPKMRSGKSLLADCVSLIATGRRAAVLTQCEDAGDERKRLLAVLLEGDPIVLFDNIERPFGTDAIAQVLTQPVFKDRLLGLSKTGGAPTCATFLATGNNLQFIGDTSARVLRCDIDPQQEHPEERTFKRKLFEWIPENRTKLVLAALTILRAYHLAGRPKQGLPAWGGFEEWSDWLRSALVWLGEADPCETRKRIEEADPVRSTLGGLLEAWRAVFGSDATTTADVSRRIEKGERTPEEDQLREAVFEAIAEDKFNARRFGHYLRHYQGRVERGFRLTKVREVSGVGVWTVTEPRKQ